MVRFSVRTGLRPQDTHVRMYTGLAILRIKPALPPVHNFCRPLLIKDSLPNHMSQIIVKLLHVLSLVLRNKHSPIYGFFCCSVANLLQTIDSPTTSAEALDLLFVGHAMCNVQCAMCNVLPVVSRHYYICVYELLTIFNAL